jgi:hypothetical protein
MTPLPYSHPTRLARPASPAASAGRTGGPENPNTKRKRMSTECIITAFAATLVLGACGSGGGGSSSSSSSGAASGSSTSGVSGAAAREFTSDLSQARRLLERNSALAPTAPEMLPGGRATFDGKVAMVYGGSPATFNAPDLVGDIDLNADFRTGAIDGWLDDFTTSDGRRIRGDLYVRNGQISGNGFAADIEGRLRGPGDVPGNVSGTIEGAFLGDRARGVAGTGNASTAQGAATLVFQAARESD